MGRKLSALCVLSVLTVMLLTGVTHAGTIKINFQLRGAPIPDGYFPDYGQPYGLQDNGLSYGWSRNIEADARHRNAAAAKDQRYDTFVHLQKGADAIWEIEVPNGTYTLFLVAGDPSNTDQVNTFDVEGVIVTDPDGDGDNFDEYNVTVQVADGRLTLKPASGSSNSKIAFIDISSDALKLGALFGKAKNPDPADGATGVMMPLFTWKPGQEAVLHDVYLGTSPELGAADLVSPHMPMTMYYHAAGLTPGATYYWRVDEIEADMTTVHTGDVWSFTSAFVTAWQPLPADGVKWVAPDAELTWKAGKNAVSHDVYLSKDKAAVEAGAPEAFQKNLYLTPWKPPALEPDTTYYWRVDEVAADGTKTTGLVWSFTTLPVIEITDPSLLAWWKMDEANGATVVDWSGHGRHAMFATPAPKWALGHFGGALEFTGTGDSAICADGSFVNGLSALTITVWVKSDVTNTDKGFIIFADPAGNDNQDMRYDAAGGTGGGVNVQKMGVSVAVDATTTTVLQLESSNDSQATDWQHVALVWSSGQPLQFYINGNLDAPTANSAPATGTLTNFSKVIIGKGGKDTASSWDGLVDEIRVYDKALPQEEIQAIMRGDPLLAWDPSPANGSTTDIVKAVPLTWQAGDKAAKHDVYLGEDRAAVGAADATDVTGIYRGRQNGTSFDPSPSLEWGRTYFWRVDEINDDGSISPGFVWSFVVADYLIVDDFEGYNDAADQGKRIYETWIDGVTNGSTSTVGNWDAPFAERTIIHGGRQSMPMDYNNINSPYYAEAEREFSPVQNWTAAGVTDLVVWFRGNPVTYLDNAGTVTMSGSGHDIWDDADDFRFASKRLSGNGSVVVKVESLVNTNGWAKAGVMIRESLNADSKFAYMIVSAAQGVSFGWRQLTAGTCNSVNQTGVAAPQWVKLTRTGDAFTAQYSADGKTWTDMKNADGTVASTSITMTSTSVYIGLCVTSHNPAATTTAVFSGAATTGGVTGQWQVTAIGDDPEPGNSPQALYLVAEDSAGKSKLITNPNPMASVASAWTEWKIPLSEFTGMNLNKVKKLYIGVGDRNNATPDGTGRIYIDDIRLVVTP